MALPTLSSSSSGKRSTIRWKRRWTTWRTRGTFWSPSRSSTPDNEPRDPLRSGDRGRSPRLRLHQRFSRQRQFHSNCGVDPGLEPGSRRALGRFFQFHGGVRRGYRRRQDHWKGADRSPGNRPQRRPRRTTGGHHLGLDHLVSRSEEHTSELQSRRDLVCRLLLEKKKKKNFISLPTAIR